MEIVDQTQLFGGTLSCTGLVYGKFGKNTMHQGKWRWTDGPNTARVMYKTILSMIEQTITRASWNVQVSSKFQRVTSCFF